VKIQVLLALDSAIRYGWGSKGDLGKADPNGRLLLGSGAENTGGL
jgi:hypothetical protein